MNTNPQTPHTYFHQGHAPHGPGNGHAPPPRTRRGLKVAAGVAAVALAAGIGVGAAHFSGSQPRVQAISDAGAHPFMTPVGTDRAGVVPAVALAGPQSGDLAELYAQDPSALPCDAAALLANLRADPARAAAWGAVLGVAPERIESYVQSLTAVTLRSDTAVVDHGYVDGTFDATPMVLAAGTAVFIDGYGAPSVRCVSGNPLTPGTSGDPLVTVVSPVAVPLTVTVFHHPVTNQPHQHPGTPPYQHPGQPGSGGSADHLGGRFNYDGSVTLSDGRLLRADGTIVDLPAPPAGSTPLPGGGYTAGGVAYNADGTPRDVLYIQAGLYVQADGTLRDYQNNVVAPAPNWTFEWNYDGTVSAIYDGPGVPDDVNDNITVWDDSGMIVSGANGVYDPATGSIVGDDGTRLNHTGTEREAVELPDGSVLEPDAPLYDSAPKAPVPAAPAAPQAAVVEEPQLPVVEEPTAEDATVEDGTAAVDPAEGSDDAPQDGADGASGDDEEGGDEAGADAAPVGEDS